MNNKIKLHIPRISRLKERTHSINNKMKLYILGVPMNKLGN